MEGQVQNGEGRTRWTPTSEQIEMLKQLYYGSGIRSPTAEQIRTISARLRRFGRIEGKNVFYWFQNHRARERQKSRLRHLPLQTPSSTITECAICCYPSQSFQWTSGVNPCNPESYTNTGNYSAAAAAAADGDDDDVDESSAELETLPLFPTHAEEASSATTCLCGTTLKPQPAAATHNYSYYTATTSCFFNATDTTSAASAVSTLTSLELSLSSTPTMNGQI